MALTFKNVNPADWSPSWVRSKQPRKQRKYVINAPKHVRRKLIVSPLSKEIRDIIKLKNLVLIVGDKVKILRGKFRGKEGSVIYIDTKKYRVYVDSAYIEKKNGEKSYYPLHASKLMIVKLNLTDKKRLEVIKRRNPNLTDEDVNNLLKISITNREDLSKVYELNKTFK